MIRTVRNACVLQDKALDIRVSDQIEQLDELIRAEKDGSAFFERTHITRGMKTLIAEGMARLAGKSAQAVFHLKQAMGGGKTHLLVAFGLLARNPELRRRVCSDVPYWDEFREARVAAFNGRNTPTEFFWGEIAKQLGRGEIFREFWANGPKAPDERHWLELFSDGEPTVILLDEMPPYFHYLATLTVGSGTVADIATRAFANLLTAAGKKSNVCVVISDLAAAYDTGSRLINRALEDARNELGRQERNITPVDLESNEVYDVLRKNLFKSIDWQVAEDVASKYGEILAEASRSKVINRSAEAIADEIINTYPFHPRLKNLIALFKENAQFKQTRGLLELMSRLLKSVWERQDDDVYLIGAQHFDLSIADVREKLAEISEMRDVIARDIWDANGSAHAQIIDAQNSGNAAAQVASILLTASLSTAVNAVKGLTKEELVECLISPSYDADVFIAAFHRLESDAWYLHKTTEGRYYFDRQENLTKMLQTYAEMAPDNKIQELIRKKLEEMFKPVRKSVYEEVLAIPELDEIAQKVRRSRVLIVADPDSKMPPEQVKRFFESLPEKNNLLVLTGEKSIASLELSARQVFAAEKAKITLPENHPQRSELNEKADRFHLEFISTILSVFDRVLFPVQRPGCEPVLESRPLDITRDPHDQTFAGEDQIESTLSKQPAKLYSDLQRHFDTLKEKAETVLWPEGQDEARWADIEDRAKSRPAMPWMEPKGLSRLKEMACSRGLWDDLGNGFVTKKPQKKKTSIQIRPGSMDDQGYVTLSLTPLNAGETYRIHYQEEGEVSETSPVVDGTTLRTNALYVNFLVVDLTGQHETGDPVRWSTTLKIRCNEQNRMVTLYVAPRADEIRYTLDGTEPRNGTVYNGPIAIGTEAVKMSVFAKCGDLEAKEQFTFGKIGDTLEIDDMKPAVWSSRPHKSLDSRQKVYDGLAIAKQMGIRFDTVVLSAGQGEEYVSTMIGEIKASAEYIETLLEAMRKPLNNDVPISMTFEKAYFQTGYDLKQFAERAGLRIGEGEVTQ